MDISRDQTDYLEDDTFESDDSDMTNRVGSLAQDFNGIAWREIEKYRERKELENILKDDLYEEIDVDSVWE